MNEKVMSQAKSEIGINFPIYGDWADPIPIDSTSQLPPFPVDALPESGREMVHMVSEVTQVDTGLTGTIYLSVLSTCLAKQAVVDLRTHAEPLNLYVCSILASGERKSATLTPMIRPLYSYQNETGAMVVVDDVTPEKLGSLMSENRERIAILSSEGGIFDIMAGRYGKKIANLDLFLKAHSGDSWSCYRMGRPAESMSAPALTICLTVQPEIIKTIGTNRQLMGRGLLARFLYSNCKPQAGFRQRQNKGISHNLVNAYGEHIINLLNIPYGERILKLTPEAQEIWDEFYNRIESELRVDGRLYHFRDWGSKLSGAVARISGLLHMAMLGDSADKQPIDLDTVNGAIAIGNYYLEHSVATFCFMGENSSIESAKKILEFIMRNGVTQFKGRDIIRHTGLRTMAEVMPGIKILLERCFIRESSAGRSGKGRPEGATYVVNPKIKGNTEKSQESATDEILAMLSN